MKYLIFLLLFVSSSFAWLEIAGATLILSTIILAIIYAVAIGFSLNELKIVAKEELYQIVATAILIALLFGGESFLEAISQNTYLVTVPGATSIQDASLKIIEEYVSGLSSSLSQVQVWDTTAAREGSSTFSCYTTSAAYFSYRPCPGYSMFGPAFAVAGGILGMAIAVLQSMYNIIGVAEEIAFTVLLPFGILLRTFKFTRGAGGLFIAFSIAIYLIVPLGVIIGNEVVKSFEESDYASYYELSKEDPVFSCGVIDTTGSIEAAFGRLVRNIRYYVSIVLFKGIFVPLVATLAFASSLSALSSAMSAEVNVSSLARFI